MELKNNLGIFNSLKEVWAKYPYGGKEGDYVIIQGEVMAWNKYEEDWGAGKYTPVRNIKYINGDLYVAGVVRAYKLKGQDQGLWPTPEALKEAIPRPETGYWAAVGDKFPAALWVCPEFGKWIDSGTTYDGGGVSLEDYYTKGDVDNILMTIKDINDTLSSGAYNITGRVGDILSLSTESNSNFVKAKISVQPNEIYELTGLGGGIEYSEDRREVTEDITSEVANGFYTYSSTEVGSVTTATRNFDGSWRCLSRAVKAGEKYIITGRGGTGGRLYCIVDSNNVIKAIAPSDDVQTELELYIEEDGTLYCSFNTNTSYKIIRKYTSIEVSDFVGPRLFCLTNKDNIIVSLADVGEKAESKILHIEQKGYLYVNFSTAMTYSLIRKVKNLEDVKDRLNSAEIASQQNKAAIANHETRIGNLENITDLLITVVTEDITSEVANGFYTYSSTEVGSVTTATRNFDGSWRCLSRAVKAGEKYIITGRGGTGGRLYCIVDSNNVIKAIAPSDDVQTELELYIEEDGTLYCSFNTNTSYKIECISTEVNIGGGTSSLWENGSFEFGRTCDCNYTAPNIDGYSLPDSNKVAAIYGWYDKLVAAYPKYVTRENCDDVMASIGESKPDAISSLPMYMYKFVPPKAPNSSGYLASQSSAQMIKVFVLTGTHNEYTAIWDCYNAMRLICEEWDTDKNLEELRWNAEIYIIPCYNLYGTDNSIRTNENGVDLNRNAPTSDWEQQGSYGDSTYSGTSAGSEYSTKVMMHYLSVLKPQVFIDHHNTNVGAGTNEGDGKNMIYTHSIFQIEIDISSVLISQMTRKWKQRYTDTFPSVEDEPNVLFGFTSYDTIRGTIGKYAAEQGVLGSIYESNFGILYKNGVYSTSNRQLNNAIVSTCATEGFINYLLRNLKAYSDLIGVKTND